MAEIKDWKTRLENMKSVSLENERSFGKINPTLILTKVNKEEKDW